MRLVTRNGHDFSKRFPQIVAAIAVLPARARIGSTVPFDFTKEFNGDGNTYIEKTTSVTATGIGNSVTLTFLGTISGGDFPAGTPAETILSATQAGGPGNTISWSASDFSQVPLPPALPLFASALGGLGLLGWLMKRQARVSSLRAA
jgi:hypothetical protein